MANWSSNAKIVLEGRYVDKSKNETPDQMLVRVAKNISEAEKKPQEWENKFLAILDSLEFLPNSPCLINAGRSLQQLSACFVLPIHDSIDQIFEMVKQSALIHKSGGGTGFNFSLIRPTGFAVQSTQGVASGPCSFMRAFDVVTDVIKQGGVRRGANMGILNITHPDIIEFINCKEEEGRFNNFNISAALTDNFLDAVKRNIGIYLHYRGQLDNKPIKAQSLLHLICQNMYNNGEPGVLFLDTINRFNPIPWMGRIYATNPCVTGDTLIAIADGRGSVSIKQLANEGKDIPIYCKDTDGWTHIRQGRNPRLTGKNKKILKVTLDNDSFVKVTEDHRFYLRNGDSIAAKDLVSGQSLMRFDRVQFKYKEHRNHKVISTTFVGYEDVYNITVDEFHNYCAVTSNTESHQSGIVLANCGEAPLLPYESCNLGSIDVSKFVFKTKAEIDWDRLKSVTRVAIRFLDNMIDMNHYPRVQITRISRLTRKVGLGIMGWADLLARLHIDYDSEEALGITRRLMGFINIEAHKESEKLGKEKGYCFRQLSRRNSCLTTIAPTGALSILADCSNGIEPHYAKSYTKTVLNDKKLEFGTEYNVKTALEISPEWHVRIQAAFQEFVDQAISKTINIPENATIEMIEKTVLLAHSLGCKGLTVYRQNSREKAPLQEIGECQGDKCLI